ncbi:Transposon Polyprotein integrase [Phytophthora palmivora]|uniref:Transposon Polyprotein integrase n=1 Tax=Phytophthora palmivora TaxID=4796 RepID=A0A2P4XME8_9STRA|nr:Transposon Polyprotein integrase [Phytophthora palmivora]
MVEDRLLDDVVYTPNAKVNIISLGYLQMTGCYRLSCSPDQRTAWLSKLDTVLKFEMHDNIYRLRTERVPGVMVMTALMEDMDSKKQMELLHQRFDHVAMETVKRLAHKPLEVLMMDVCSIKPATVGGAGMFLFVVDEATRYKWAFLMENKGEATFHIKVLINRLRTKLPEYKVVRLWSDQGGAFLSKELENYCNEFGIEAKTTNSYSPQENGIVERANGIVLPRIRAMLGATRLPSILWGEALLHVVETLNSLPTKPMGLTSPRRRLFRDEPMLDDLRVWGCIAHVRVPPESRQRKEKLEPRARISLLLGYSLTTPGYKFLDLKTAQVVTAQGQRAVP